MSKIKFKLYEVGGHVRDGLLGIKSNDIDYAVVVLNPDDFVDEHEAFKAFHEHLDEDPDFEIFLSTPDVFTIRAKQISENEVRDFVLARKEVGHKEGTRKPAVVGLGTLEDDLRRRDFTVNCIARDSEAGEIIDPFGGQQDLKDGILRTPIDPNISFNDDPLRLIRLMRFSITKDFRVSDKTLKAFRDFDIQRFKETVSKERVYEELKKMFAFDSSLSMALLIVISEVKPELYEVIMKDMKMTFVPKLGS